MRDDRIRRGRRPQPVATGKHPTRVRSGTQSAPEAGGFPPMVQKDEVGHSHVRTASRSHVAELVRSERVSEGTSVLNRQQATDGLNRSEACGESWFRLDDSGMKIPGIGPRFGRRTESRNRMWIVVAMIHPDGSDRVPDERLRSHVEKITVSCLPAGHRRNGADVLPRTAPRADVTMDDPGNGSSKWRMDSRVTARNESDRHRADGCGGRPQGHDL